MSKNEQNTVEKTVKQPSTLWQKMTIGATAVALSVPAFAADSTVIDLTTGLGGVAVLGGLMAAGQLKALPTYAAWGIKKALSMLR
ncbi:hypothetical protein I2F17_12230 [Acinetobacter sp. B10A]|uniref:hypothetical protein n=1 Tax=Acinetobacter baretiae TaxID=2605383 RepID=UPI001B3C6608|nr:hypothetical protein [Acinetobacter baretiae]MBF7686585.1 hypothetical protein [Acinetobacter baretiae]